MTAVLNGPKYDKKKGFVLMKTLLSTKGDNYSNKMPPPLDKGGLNWTLWYQLNSFMKEPVFVHRSFISYSNQIKLYL